MSGSTDLSTGWRRLKAVHVSLTMEIPIIWQGLGVPAECPVPGVGMRRSTGALLAAAFATAFGVALAAPAHAQDLSHADFSHTAAQYTVQSSAQDHVQPSAKQAGAAGASQNNCPGNPD